MTRAKSKGPAATKAKAKVAGGARSKAKKESAQKTGRPTDYDSAIHPALAEAWAAAGKTDKQIAEKLGKSESTLNLWKKQHSEFSESLKRGKADPDDKVEACLFSRATGYDYKAVKIFMPANAKEPVYADYVEHCPPDVTAMIYWLNNRRPNRWRNRHEVTGPDGGPLEASLLSPSERKARIAELLKKRAQA
jgi:hypothetical protein